ncbi:MAG: 5'/3'-nucleotidase SurE [Clostridia bacterium]|nr:5'/3'-nucleotidase SurE [Clostridia bacterium]
MRILITNDDGIAAPGLRALVDWAKKLGEVEVFAPLVEQSGKSVGLELRKSFHVEKYEYEGVSEAYTVDSTPVDCVRIAVLGFERKYDLVLSGVNSGKNLGYDINYSGTVGAVLEASMLGMKGIAVSAGKKSLEGAAENFDKVYDYFVKHDLLSLCDVYNVNIPKNGGEIAITRQGGVRFSDKYIDVGDGMYFPEGYNCYKFRGDKTIDIDAMEMGYISVTPLTFERTDFKTFEMLK